MAKLTIVPRLNALMAAFRSKYKVWPDCVVVSKDLYIEIRDSDYFVNTKPHRSKGQVMGLEIYVKLENAKDYMSIGGLLTIKEKEL